MAVTSLALGSNRTIVDDLVGVARRRKAVILITTLATTLTVYLGLLFVPERYEATAQLQVMLGRENTELPAAVQRGNVYPTGVQREEINTDIQLLKSRESVENVVDVMGLEPFRFDPQPPRTLFQYIKHAARVAKDWAQDTVVNGLILIGLKKELTEREKVIALLTSSLDAVKEGDSNVIRVSLRLPGRKTATEALATVIRSYFDRQASLRAKRQVLSILEAQVSGDTGELENLQRQRKQIKHEWGLSSIERQRTELLQRLHKVLYEMEDRKSQLAAAEASRAVIAKRSATIPIIGQDLKISGLQAAIKQDETNAQGIDRTLAGLNEAGERLELVDLQIDASKKRLMSDMARRDSARVDQELDQHQFVNVAVISDVAASPEPVSPYKLRFMAFGVLGGFILGTTLGTLLEWGDDTIHGREEFAGLPNLPFLGEFRLGQSEFPAEVGHLIEAVEEPRNGSPPPQSG